MKAAAEQLNAAWKDTGGRALFIGDYYTKSTADIRSYLSGLGFSMEAIGTHAGMVDTSELLFVNPVLVRSDRRKPGRSHGGSEGAERRVGRNRRACIRAGRLLPEEARADTRLPQGHVRMGRANGRVARRHQ